MTATAATIPEEDRVSIPAKLGYGMGAVGAQIFRDTPALILPIYMITVLGIPAWIAGISILIPKAWVIFCDPLVGGWSDRKRESWGRAPFLFAGGFLSALSFAMMFSAPRFDSVLASAAYMTLAFTIASTAFSLFSVPYLSVAAEMSNSPQERTRILSFRIIFLAVGVALGAGYALPAANYLGGGWEGFSKMGMVFGLICAVTMLGTWATVRKVKLVKVEDEGEARSGKDDMKAIWANKPFVILSSAYFVALAAQAVTYTVMGLYFIYIIKDPNELALMSVFASLSVLVGQPLTVWLNRFFSKNTLYFAGIIGWSLLCVSWYTAGPTEIEWLAANLGINVPMWVPLGIRGFFWGLFNSMYLLMALSFLTDTIQMDRDRSGVSRAGVFSGIFSAIEKVAFAFGPAVAGVLLSAGGFEGGKSGESVLQTDAAILTLVITFCVIPAFVKLASLLIFMRYREQ